MSHVDQVHYVYIVYTVRPLVALETKKQIELSMENAAGVVHQTVHSSKMEPLKPGGVEPLRPDLLDL